MFLKTFSGINTRASRLLISKIVLVDCEPSILFVLFVRVDLRNEDVSTLLKQLQMRACLAHPRLLGDGEQVPRVTLSHPSKLFLS